MRRQDNEMPLKTPHSSKTDPWGIKREEIKSHRTKLFKRITKKILKIQINKQLGEFNECITRLKMNIINKMIR